MLATTPYRMSTLEAGTIFGFMNLNFNPGKKLPKLITTRDEEFSESLVRQLTITISHGFQPPPTYL